NPAGLDRLDYFASQLTKQGVYYGWLHTFKFRVRPGNRDRLLAYDEIEKNLKGDTYAFINIAEDVQDLMIEMVVNLLKHRNPHTGKTYAEDPALCFIELQNEDDIFFYTNERALNACPTYKKRFIERYAEWLQKKYGSTENLKKAWGDALGGNETLEAKNISLQGNPWFFGEDNLPNKKGGERQRLLDNAAFFHDVQNRFYGRFAQAIRDAGYQGPLIGSPWQAPAMLPHYYNLHSDALVGVVDRHNYFGGKLSDTMLKEPGSGYFSTGLQQVAGHPFALSEWIHVYPSLYSAEGPALVAAYGMGLQGWDASYEFQSGASAFSEIVGNFPWGVWNADVPAQIGQYPLLARMIARGDVKQGETISVRRVSLPELAEGKFSFSDKVTQQGDIKTFTGSVPAEALAAGRCLVNFTDKPQPSTFPDMSQYRKGKVIQSNTGQLQWDTTDQGHFTINTPGTKGVIGFAEGQEATLGNVRIKLASPYASVLVTAADRGADLSNTKRALISALARNANSGFSYFELDQRVLDNGKAPILLEPVKATIALTGRPIAVVNILDHDGKATGRTVPVTNGTFTIDGSRDKAFYYEVVFGSG
ncbi:MAG: beta-galactosidase, partial [Armatimonadota bacterium]|nr:beta-galactosidase [Armatimonadota bacterium]